jgi:3-oxoacyl-[acyl-carrier-protein] synthase-3
MPPAVLTNADIATFLKTDDAWITSRTGMKERRISHVPAVELATIAARRAIACAGLKPADIDLVLYGSL